MQKAKTDNVRTSGRPNQNGLYPSVGSRNNCCLSLNTDIVRSFTKFHRTDAVRSADSCPAWQAKPHIGLAEWNLSTAPAGDIRLRPAPARHLHLHLHLHPHPHLHLHLHLHLQPADQTRRPSQAACLPPRLRLRRRIPPDRHGCRSRGCRRCVHPGQVKGDFKACRSLSIAIFAGLTQVGRGALRLVPFSRRSGVADCVLPEKNALRPVRPAFKWIEYGAQTEEEALFSAKGGVDDVREELFLATGGADTVRPALISADCGRRTRIRGNDRLA